LEAAVPRNHQATTVPIQAFLISIKYLNEYQDLLSLGGYYLELGLGAVGKLAEMFGLLAFWLALLGVATAQQNYKPTTGTRSLWVSASYPVPLC
jgi:hypothetical protein